MNDETIRVKSTIYDAIRYIIVSEKQLLTVVLPMLKNYHHREKERKKCHSEKVLMRKFCEKDFFDNPKMGKKFFFLSSRTEASNSGPAKGRALKRKEVFGSNQKGKYLKIHFQENAVLATDIYVIPVNKTDLLI